MPFAVKVLFVGVLTLGSSSFVFAQSGTRPQVQPAVTAASAAPQTAAVNLPVVVSGTVPDEATRQAILSRLREIYGSDRVVDQMGVSNLIAPPNWAQHVQKMIQPDLKLVSRGQLSIKGNIAELRGEVSNEAQRQQIVSKILNDVGNPTYTLRNGLRVTGPGQEQEKVDAVLSNQIVEFEPASAKLTEKGKSVLNGLLPVLKQMNVSGKSFEIIGHTDAQGNQAANLRLSSDRAEAVKAYLVNGGIPAEKLTTMGAGANRPIADNSTEEGRARNRRIEVRVGQVEAAQ